MHEGPERVGVFHGFVLGILLDLIEGVPLGQNALLLSLLAFLCALVYPRFRAYSLLQQAVLILVLLGTIQLVEQWLRTLLGPFSIHLSFLLPSVIGAILWPWLTTLFRAFRRRTAKG
ncbi:Rod shape-determining protein MreD [Halomonas elongata]|uniref:Rod shape-determining protein MreD n=1 Tax=Halomonas elongata TaxID=2746 RepID=A0A1B8P4Z2_HALEL|nr:Rod shape-determining protein MreD [Halomonas elongata]